MQKIFTTIGEPEEMRIEISYTDPAGDVSVRYLPDGVSKHSKLTEPHIYPNLRAALDWHSARFGSDADGVPLNADHFIQSADLLPDNPWYGLAVCNFAWADAQQMKDDLLAAQFIQRVNEIVADKHASVPSNRDASLRTGHDSRFYGEAMDEARAEMPEAAAAWDKSVSEPEEAQRYYLQ